MDNFVSYRIASTLFSDTSYNNGNINRNGVFTNQKKVYSALVFRVADSGWNAMKYFSLKHSWQDLVTGLKTLALERMFQNTLQGTF